MTALLTRALLLSFVVMLIAGCADFKPSPLDPAESYALFESRTLDSAGLMDFIEANLHQKSSPWPPESWDLNMLTLAAFYYHPDLDVAREKRGLAKAGVITAGERPNPTVGFTPEYNADSAAGISPWILGFNLNIPVETAGKRGYRMEKAAGLSEAARMNIAGEAWRVRKRLRGALLDLYAALEREAALKRQQGLQREIAAVLEERLRRGEASSPDVTFARISLDRTVIALRDAEKQAAEARSHLAGSVGLPDVALEHAAISFNFLDELPEALPAPEIRRQALLNRADILGSLYEYGALEAALKLEAARQYPDINIGPGYKWDQGDNKWSLGFSVTIPVLNRNQGPIAEALARRKEARARFIALQARVSEETGSALSGYRAALEELHAADGLLATHRGYLASAKSMFNAGEIDRLVLLGRELEVESAVMARLDAFVNAQRSLALLEDALQRPLGGEPSFAPPEAAPARDTMIKKEKA